MSFLPKAAREMSATLKLVAGAAIVIVGWCLDLENRKGKFFRRAGGEHEVYICRGRALSAGRYTMRDALEVI